MAKLNKKLKKYRIQCKLTSYGYFYCEARSKAEAKKIIIGSNLDKVNFGDGYEEPLVSLIERYPEDIDIDEEDYYV